MRKDMGMDDNAKTKELVGEEGVAEGYWQDAVKKAEASREARKGKPFEKNPAVTISKMFTKVTKI